MHPLFFLIVLYPYLFLSKLILYYPSVTVKLGAWGLQLQPEVEFSFSTRSCATLADHSF